MVRRASEPDHSSERSKIRVFYAEVDGSPQTVQDLMRTLTAAIGRSNSHSLPPPRHVQEAPATDRETIAPNPKADDDETIVDIDDGLSPHDISQGAPETTGSRRRRGQGPKVDRNAGVALVSDLDFLPKEKVSLKDFFSEKSPGSDMEQVLVFAYYFRHYMDLEQVGPGHILTAYKHVGKPVPVDLRQTIRNAKNNKVWLSCTDREKIRVTTEGENFVEHKLPKASSNGDRG